MLPYRSHRNPHAPKKQQAPQNPQPPKKPQAPQEPRALRLRPNKRRLIAMQLIALQLTALQLSLQLSGCGHFRTYTNYKYNKVDEKTETKKLKNPVYKTKIIQKEKDYYLKIQEKQQCRELAQDILEEQAQIKTVAPLSWIYIGGGAALAAVSIPFYYMAGKAENTTRKRNNSLVGSFLFLVPGLAAIGFGIYQRLQVGTKTETLGKTTRTTSEKAIPCGSQPATGKEIKLGTRIGTLLLGKTDEQGEIKLPHRTIQPLIRHSFDKIEKVYIDVILENDNLGEIDIPWPVKRPRE